MIFLSHCFFVFTILQGILSEKNFTRDSLSQGEGLSLAKVVPRGLESFQRRWFGLESCSGDSCHHLIGRRQNPLRKRQCGQTSNTGFFPPWSTGWPMALWMPALFGPPMDADGNPCPTSSETQESQVRVLRKEAPAVGHTARKATKQRGTKGSKGLGSDVKDESKQDRKRWLNAHNRVRATYHAAPLTWNDQITPFAKAEVRRCIWKHSKAGPGENIAAGQLSIENVVSDWTEGPGEKSVYDPHNPTYSHFTQVVWVGTRSISCARYTCQNVRGLRLPQSPVIFWACEYYPPGNVIGQFQQNVKSGNGGVPLKYLT